MDNLSILRALNVISNVSALATSIRDGFILDHQLSTAVTQFITDLDGDLRILQVEKILRDTKQTLGYKYNLHYVRDQSGKFLKSDLDYLSVNEIQVCYRVFPTYGIEYNSFITLKFDMLTQEVSVVDIQENNDEKMNEFLRGIADEKRKAISKLLSDPVKVVA